jgi:hypothetical protein
LVLEENEGKRSPGSSTFDSLSGFGSELPILCLAIPLKMKKNTHPEYLCCVGRFREAHSEEGRVPLAKGFTCTPILCGGDKNFVCVICQL